MKKKFNHLKIGLLGGGQLGRMLLQKAADFSLTVKVLDPDHAAPSRYLASEFVNGSFNDHDTVYAFGKSCDLITIEIEHVNVDALEKLEAEGIAVYPQPSVIRMVQDKGLQKMFYRDNGFPSTDFNLVNSREELSSLLSSDKLPVIQKLRKGGYDGKGVFKISSVADLPNSFDAPSVVEKVVNFKTELSVIVARNVSGQVKSFPAVDMKFNPAANLVEYLFSPISLGEEIEKKAARLAEAVAEKLGVVGLLAVEMFVDDSGEILINEIAPRPHNSGHHTIEANLTSQYEQHLRAILDLPLGNTSTTHNAVLINLLGEKNYEGPACYESLENALAIDGVFVHLYGKKFTRPFRKMGHVTVVASTMAEAQRKAAEIKKLLKVISE